MWVPTVLMDGYSLVSGVTSHVSWDYKLVSFTVGAVDLYLVLECIHGLGNHICRDNVLTLQAFLWKEGFHFRVPKV